MKRILVVGDYIKGSGLTSYLLSLYSSLPNDEFEITCMSFSGFNDVDDIIFAHQWKKYSVTPVGVSIIRHLIDWFLFFVKHGRDFQFIHFNYSASWNFGAVLLAKLMSNSKILIQSHSLYYSKQPKNALQKKMLDIMNGIGRIVMNSCADKRLAVSTGAGKWMFGQDKTVQILKNGIDLKKFRFDSGKRKSIRIRSGIAQNKIVIGFVGGLIWRKNPKFAINCLEELNRDDDKYVLYILGRGKLQNSLQTYVKKHGLSKKVFFFGVQENVGEWYSAFDVFIFPSITEAFGFALLEAQANGLQCITSTNVPEDAKVSSSVTSLNLRNIESWVKALKRVNLSMKYRIHSADKACRMIDEQGFSLKKTSKDFVTVIKRLEE